MNIRGRKRSDVTWNELPNEEAICLKIPWKGITFAFVLTSTGLILLCLGILTIIGYLDEKYGDRMISFFLLGGLTFIPGAYHLFIAYCAFTRKPGYSYDDIPDLD